ncbi:DUF4783 domain-containing protein [Mucilaginibacter sp.]|jgi:hypothetical protein|uniref:DUF4783 domain-containing protein n=1 Tax=Mucilaginibacter sp. TaxID=1882438 RepID=UPI0025E5ABC8|nr:DUF4783 domain-containing protein [Mucilaginibacter sp.]
MKLFCLSSLIFLLLIPHAVLADPLDNVANLVKQGNTKELGKLFAANVDLVIMENENTYSKDQAIQILNTFFAKNKPLSIKLLHKINSSASFHLGVYILTTTDKQEYRVAFTLKDQGGTMNIVDFRIEDEKVK